ncbi:hypothetical protein [Xanthobacter sp. KR7-225]|uniref:Acb2/Tad1 domain-containing protein n=1 Tax=Xanthobacter sp. KR7-225 TaxID=3156613 RepID=UPI0032B55719
MADQAPEPPHLRTDVAIQLRDITRQGEAFLALLRSIGVSRELSLAATKVEEAVFWAAKHATKERS